MRQGIPSYTGALLGTIAGACTAIFAAFVGGSAVQMAVIPVALALLIFLILDRKTLLILILALRSAGDVVLDSTRFSLGGYQIGVGGVINAFVILIVLLLVLEKPQLLPRKVVTMWAVFLLAALLSLTVAPVPSDAIRTYLSLLSYFAVFVSAFYVVRSTEDFRFCVKIIVWSSAIPAAYALFELATAGLARPEGFRLQSTFGHPNILAFYLTLVVCLTLYLLKSGARTLSMASKAGLGCYMLLLIALLAFTQTRSAWLACFTIFAAYALFFERRYLLYVAIAPLAALLVPGVHERLLDLGTGNEYVQYAKLNSFAWRRLIWETGLQWMRVDHYFLGYGLESFRHHSLTFFPLANQAGAGFGAHNIYVQVLFEIGIVGLLAYLWLFCRLLAWTKSLYSLDRLAAVLVAGLTVAYLIISFSDNMFAYLSFNWYFWFLGGAASALAVMNEGRGEWTHAPAGPGSAARVGA